MLLNMEGFTYALLLDISMVYYRINLSHGDKQVCTIVLPWVKYEYQKIPMGYFNITHIF